MVEPVVEREQKRKAWVGRIQRQAPQRLHVPARLGAPPFGLITPRDDQPPDDDMPSGD
jgi:hypothetical protein